MGQDARITVYAPSQKAAEDACAAAFERIAQLDSIMSDYRPSSELMQLCDKAGGPPVLVSPDLFRVLKMAEKVSLESDGMFDITVGPVVHLWRTARQTGVLPTPQEVENARALVDWRKVELNEADQTACVLVPGMRLDLGAIGKGYAVDEGQAVLTQHGVTCALIEMGGNLEVTDPPPGKKGWSIEIPNAEKGGKQTIMTLANCAISTSGDTEQFVAIGGKHYSHVVNPHTGYALTTRVQATVITPTGLIGDPIAMACTVLDHASRKTLLAHYPDAKAFVKQLKD